MRNTPPPEACTGFGFAFMGNKLRQQQRTLSRIEGRPAAGSLPGPGDPISIGLDKAITIVSSALAPSMTSVTFQGANVTESPGETSAARVHVMKSERAKRLFSSVPLGAAEQLPDPDYGL